MIYTTIFNCRYVDPVEYDESDSLILAEQDTDLRTLAIDRVPHGDIDHRNLISLTSSPRDETCWSSNKDTDYRYNVFLVVFFFAL